ncbi:DUF975 family protein [Caproicibacter sp.]|uniref:DUF975 family protein n=1 Tax=Caproicibacter sp. TaxID=2814884 RepID=UPI003988CA01
MWDRSILKSNAKVALRGRYWTAFLVTFIFLFLTEGFQLVNPGFWHRFGVFPWFSAETRAAGNFIWSFHFGWLGILYAVFIVQPLVIGVSRYFVRNHYESAEVETAFSGFRWNYMNGVGAMFITELFIFLWTLLLIIPGIVKGLEYSMVPFLLSDNPSLPGERARQISRRMTDGQKGAIFIFDLSFLGWFLLGALCFGVGMLFVLPYYSAAQAELYLFLRDRALRMEFVRPEELCLGRSGAQL